MASEGIRERGRIDPVLALIVGIGAGVLATAIQLGLWWAAEMPVLDTLLRDARFTAAMVMGERILPPPLTPRWDILAVATLIHFALSFAYALVLAPLVRRVSNARTLMAGAVYGLAIYAVNLHGMALLFPWFVQTRDWVTLATHAFFGVALAGGYRLLDCGLHVPPMRRFVPPATPGG